MDQSPVLNQAQLMESIMLAMQRSAALEEAIVDPVPPLVPPTPQNPPTQQQHANNAFETTLLQKFEELTKELAQIKRGMGETENGGRNTRGRQGREPKRYCWSCGCVPHFGRNCPNKKAGHKDDANFRDRKGGSDENCRPNN